MNVLRSLSVAISMTFSVTAGADIIPAPDGARHDSEYACEREFFADLQKYTVFNEGGKKMSVDRFQQTVVSTGSELIYSTIKKVWMRNLMHQMVMYDDYSAQTKIEYQLGKIGIYDVDDAGVAVGDAVAECPALSFQPFDADCPAEAPETYNNQGYGWDIRDAAGGLRTENRVVTERTNYVNLFPRPESTEVRMTFDFSDLCPGLTPIDGQQAFGLEIIENSSITADADNASIPATLVDVLRIEKARLSWRRSTSTPIRVTVQKSSVSQERDRSSAKRTHIQFTSRDTYTFVRENGDGTHSAPFQVFAWD